MAGDVRLGNTGLFAGNQVTTECSVLGMIRVCVFGRIEEHSLAGQGYSVGIEDLPGPTQHRLDVGEKAEVGGSLQ